MKGLIPATKHGGDRASPPGGAPQGGQVLELLCSGTRLLLWDGQCGHRGAGNKVRGTCPRCDSRRTCVSAYWIERVALGRVLSLSEPHLLPGRKRNGSEMGPKHLDLWVPGSRGARSSLPTLGSPGLPHLRFLCIQSLTCRSGSPIHWPWLRVTMEPSMDCMQKEPTDPGLSQPLVRSGSGGTGGLLQMEQTGGGQGGGRGWGQEMEEP